MPAPDPTLWTAARRILDLLDDLPPEADRDAHAREACLRDDGTLNDALYTEVCESLAAEDASDASGFLATDAAQAAAHLLAAGGVEAVGRRVGPWEIDGLLGEGGMGAVYRAHRADGAYAQEVALKVIGRGLAPPSLLDRFRRERQILAGLSHPNVARLLDGGVSDEGQPYFAMELVDGEPITAYVARLGLDTDARLRLLRQVCDAVAYAHRRLIVHRDLKPSNVLVTEDDDGAPRAVLLDFGIAKLLDADADASRTAALLTPDYAAPEQLAGDEITTAADVYALGLLLYEVLAGQRPHADAGASPTERLRAMTALPPPPSALAGRRPSDLDAVVLKALAPEPERRYVSADALGDDIDHAVAGLPVTARRPTTAYRMRTFVRRHPLGVAVATAFVTVLIGFSALTTVQARRLADERDRAEAEAATTQAVSDFVLGLFRASNPGESRGVETTAGELLDRGVERTARLDGAPEVKAEVLRTLGTVQMQLGDYERAHAVLTDALALARQHSSPRDLVLTLNVLAALEWRRRAIAPSEALAREAIALADATPTLPDSLRLAPRIQLAITHISREEYDRAEPLLTSGREASDRLRAGHPLQLAILNNLGMVYRGQGDLERAEAVARDVLALRRQVQGDDHPDTASALRSVGIVLEDRGQTEEATLLIREALAIQRRVLPRPHRNTIDTIKLLARFVSPAEAVLLLRDAVEQVEMLYPPDHPSIAGARRALAEAEARVQ